ncbi:MAG TPA: hypothetical protein ENG72_01685 [Thermococcus sp.]|nr:hypothetical protein [Thermococcus sp.]
MPKKRKQDEYKPQVEKIIEEGKYINGTKLCKEIPSPENAREELEKLFQICSNRDFRVILVEDLEDYKVFIQIPGDKSECDFFVWRGIFDGDKLIDLKIPTHDDLGQMFSQLKQMSENIEEHLINATIRLLRDRINIEEIMTRYFQNEQENIKHELKKFLTTLKWIGLQEDVNYPPPKYLGSKFTLAVYALLETGFQLKDLRRIIKFRL